MLDLSFGLPIAVRDAALKMVARASRLALPQDFFTPHPRRVKGKEKAVPHDDPSACTIPSMTDATALGALSTGPYASVHRLITPSHPYVQASGTYPFCVTFPRAVTARDEYTAEKCCMLRVEMACPRCIISQAQGTSTCASGATT